MPIIRVDDEVYKYLNDQGKTEDAFNDVLRRVLGFEPRKKQLHDLPTHKTVKGEGRYVDDNESIERLMEKHLPPYLINPIHCRQLVKLVRYFLRSPGNWPTKDREIAAAKKVAEEEGVTRETIQDGGTRRLGLNIEGFRKRLEAIEAESRQVHGAEE